jgi:hypothetical protein
MMAELDTGKGKGKGNNPNTMMVFEGSPFHPSWWLSLRHFLTFAEKESIINTSSLMRCGAISHFEKLAECIVYPSIHHKLIETMKEAPPEILMQHLWAEGNTDAMWMKLREYLGEDNWAACFLTNRGDADVILEMRARRLDWAQRELNETWEEREEPGTNLIIGLCD